jgi:hypothetical protein
MAACHERYGDTIRFLSTAFVARDMDAIREALQEEELTAMLISYGTGIGQSKLISCRSRVTQVNPPIFDSLYPNVLKSRGTDRHGRHGVRQRWLAAVGMGIDKPGQCH